jgi:hypothetical protein
MYIRGLDLVLCTASMAVIRLAIEPFMSAVPLP